MREVYAFTLLVTAGSLVVGCGGGECTVDGVVHSCVYSPTNSQTLAMSEGKAKLEELDKIIPQPPLSAQYDSTQRPMTPSQKSTLTGNFEDHTTNLIKYYFSNADQKYICEIYKSYLEVDLQLKMLDGTSCGDRHYDNGIPIYGLGFQESNNTTFLLVSIRIKQNKYRTRDSKQWRSRIEFRAHYKADRNNSKRCFGSGSDYNYYCSDSNWHEADY